jgi:hypothetical protein
VGRHCELTDGAGRTGMVVRCGAPLGSLTHRVRADPATRRSVARSQPNRACSWSQTLWDDGGRCMIG